MSTPSAMPPPPSSPPPPAPSGRRGCIIAVVVTVVVLLVLMVGCVWYVYGHATKLASAAFRNLRPTAMAAVDAGVSDDLRKAFAEEYDAQLAYIEGLPAAQKEQLPKVITPFQQLQEALADKKLTAEEIERFNTSARESRGAGPPA